MKAGPHTGPSTRVRPLLRGALHSAVAPVACAYAVLRVRSTSGRRGLRQLRRNRGRLPEPVVGSGAGDD